MSAQDHEENLTQPADGTDGETVSEEETGSGTENASEEAESGSENSSEETGSGPEEASENEVAADETTTTGMPEMAPPLFVVCFVLCVFVSSVVSYQFGYSRSLRDAELAQTEEDAYASPEEENVIPDDPIPVEFPEEHETSLPPAEMTVDMQELYAQNHDFIGWLKIDDMNIDYPVMQSLYDEEYYLNRDFNKNQSLNGCLIMDTDSVVGTGTKANDYEDGTPPSTNLIIHGHNMKNGDMFGNLDKYRDEKFYETHKIIKFQTLYEEREYEIVSVFLSQVYLKTQTDVFKYYKFFRAKNEEEFDDFYNNIKDLSLYDTGVSAEFGDEFITLSVCAYHVENGRLAVVGKRIK